MSSMIPSRPKFSKLDSYRSCLERVAPFVSSLEKYVEVNRHLLSSDEIGEAEELVEEYHRLATKSKFRVFGGNTKGRADASDFVDRIERLVIYLEGTVTKCDAKQRKSKVATFKDLIRAAQGDEQVQASPDGSLILEVKTGRRDVPTFRVKFDPIQEPRADGHYCVVFSGTAVDQPQVQYALKRIKCRVKYQDALVQEAAVWSQLSHPRVLPFSGFTFVDEMLYLVSPLQGRGSLETFLGTRPETDRLPFIYDLADGLAYLHTTGLWHGDVKAANILVSKGCRGMLCDFGLSKFGFVEETRPELQGAGSSQFASPEYWSPPPGQRRAKTMETDVYAFAMTCTQILSPTVDMPFQGLSGDEVCGVVCRGERPPMLPKESPKGVSYEPVWAVIAQCWAHDPEQRPKMQVVHRTFSSMAQK